MAAGNKTRLEYNLLIFDILEKIIQEKDIKVDQAYNLLGIETNDFSQVEKSTEEILDLLKKFIQDYPEQRFLQASINLGIASDDLIPWMEESKVTYEKILDKTLWDHQQEWVML